jgi:PAS domain S-box-containing protein/diguanylate cyclase (GGDEF)-like protein
LSSPNYLKSIGQLSLMLSLISKKDGSFFLEITQSDDSLREFLSIDAEMPIAGVPAADIFQYDQLMLDDWIEFILKTDSKTCEKQDGDYTLHTLQFCQAIKGWVRTVLTYSPEQNSAAVTLAPPPEDKMTVDTRHFMDVRQAAMLGNYFGENSSWEMDLGDNTIYLSRTLAKALHFADGAVVVPLQRFLDAVHPEDIGVVMHALQNVHSSYSTVYNRGILEDGSLVHFNSFAIPRHDEHGQMARITGHSQNITEKKSAMQELLRSEQLFRGIVENSQDLFIVLSRDRKIAYVSPSVYEISGYRAEEVLGLDFAYFLASEKHRTHACQIFDNAFAGISPVRGEYEIRRADGGIAWLQIDLSPVTDMDGEQFEIAAVCRDITKDISHMEKLRYINSHDTLTNAYNRQYFEEELRRIDRDGVVGLGLIITDLNGLKLVNDTLGHDEGDQMLVSTYNLLSSLDEEYIVSRIGGDEFALFVYNCTLPDLEHICRRITEKCKKTKDTPIPLSISMGYAHRASVKQSIAMLYKQAEGRMYSNKLLESRSMHSQVLTSLKEALKVRNVETSDHMQRMENMVNTLGNRLGLSSSELDRLLLLASMHDIGKVAIPDHIISKPGRLTLDEWEVMRTHSELGGRIATTSQELSIIANEISCHHEHYNGSGYPYGYTGKQIPFLSRIISVVDSYDVMTHKRVYKEAISHEEAVAELKRCAGTQFDPEIVSLFLEIFGTLTEEELSAAMACPTPDQSEEVPGKFS